MTQSDKANSAAATAKTPKIIPAQVKGWGVDANTDNDPTRPMRDRRNDPGATWERPPLQTPTVEILRSTEHTQLPAVLGTTLPPRGCSGRIRRRAFALSESQWGHWLLLMLADRVDILEGLADDIRQGTLPNPLVEMGFVPKARSREAAVASIALVGVAVATLCILSRHPRRD